MSEELKLCPFCKSPIKKSLSTGLVSCNSPFCPINKCQMDERQWQSRPIEDALRAKLDEAKEAHDNLAQQLGNANDTVEIAVDALIKINDWAQAYPLEVWPEPDWEKVKELLGSHLLSCVSASNMRHVIDSVKNITHEVLQKLEG